MLDTEFRYFLDHQGELVKRYNNRVLVIIGEKVVADYDDFDAYTDTFCSPVFS